jgi:NADH-quinone oxidoreductase subunit D
VTEGPSRQLTVSTRDLGGEELVLDLGAHHPASHGALRLALTLDGDVITGARPVIGSVHRGAEKLFEVRDYRQALVLANRHDWLSAFSNEIGLVLAVERMLGMEVPVRAVWIRTLLAELTRVLNHLAFLGSPTGWQARERLQLVMEEFSGGRLHSMANQVGGLKVDAPVGWGGRVRSAVVAVREDLAVIADATVQDAEFQARHEGVGRLDAALVPAYGLSGPVARASGVDHDLRRDEPYLAYAELADVLRVVTRTSGDCLARYEVLVEQCVVSLDLAEACLDVLADLPPGPVSLKLPKVLRVPEGETYTWTENPLGINGYYLVSRGDKTPWRLKLRSASFNNVQVLEALLPGQRLGDLVTILQSMVYVLGDVDK